MQSPYLDNGKLNAAARRGQRLFQTARCGTCHWGSNYTNLRKYDVGTGGEFDTPTLVEVWRTAPYLNDGRSNSLRDVVTKDNPNDRHGVTSDLTPQQIEDLAAFVLSL